MKKTILVILTLTIAILSFTACGTPAKQEYAMTTVVVSVDYDADEVTCMDFNGNNWVFTGCEDWLVGDYCSMIMSDNGTDIIYDDEIVATRYSGWLDGVYGFDGFDTLIEMR